MNKLIVSLLAVLVLFFGGVAFFYAEKAQEVINTPRPLSNAPQVLNPREIFTLVNDYRVQNGLNPLVWNDSMCTFANLRANQLPLDYSHNGFWPNAESYYKASNYTENIDTGFDNNEVVQEWINSPEHRNAILDSRYTDTCVGTLKYNYAVQEFASF